MAIMRFNPFWDMDKFFEDELPKEMSKRGFFSPPIDVYETDKNFVVEIPLAGVNPDDVDLNIDEDNVLTIKGETKKEEEVKDRDYFRKEVYSGSFSRSFQLPENAEGDSAEAEFEDGMLKVAVPKVEPKPKQKKALKITRK